MFQVKGILNELFVNYWIQLALQGDHCHILTFNRGTTHKSIAIVIRTIWAVDLPVRATVDNAVIMFPNEALK